MLALSNENDWVLDPYCAPPLALLAGLKHRRRVVGCDPVPRTIAAVRDSIAAFAFEGEHIHGNSERLRPRR